MKTALYLIVKNERFFEEFIFYYKNVMNINFFIILDDFSDSVFDYDMAFKRLDLKKYKDYLIYHVKDLNINMPKKITFSHEYKSSIFIQNVLYELLLKNDIDYVMQFDCDEFLFFNGGDINSIINKYYPFDSLRINWLFFGSNDVNNKIIKTNNNNSIIKTFFYCDDKYSNLTKSITRVKSIDKNKFKSGISAHFIPVCNDCITKNLLNEPINNSEVKIHINNKINSLDLPYLAHYINQDFDTFVKRKIIRLYEFQHILNVDEIIDRIEYLEKNIFNFQNYLYKKTTNDLNSEELKSYSIQFSIVPVEFIEYLVSFFNFHNKNAVINTNIYDKFKIIYQHITQNTY